MNSVNFDWESIDHNKILEALRNTDVKKLMGTWSTPGLYSSTRDIQGRPEFLALMAEAPKKSIASILYALSHVPGGTVETGSPYVFDPARSYDEVPTSKDIYLCQNDGITIEEISYNDARAWDRTRKRRVCSRVLTASHPSKNAFRMLREMIETRFKGMFPGWHFLNLMADCGWFGTQKKEIIIEMEVSENPSSTAQYHRGKWTDQNMLREKEYSMNTISLTVDGWSFRQGDSFPLRRSDWRCIMDNYGYTDQIIMTKVGTEGMESLVIYLDTQGSRIPYYQIRRSDDLEDLVGGKFWTEKELRLTEMMDLRGEIFLDRPDVFPILTKIPELTTETLDELRNECIPVFSAKRDKIFDMFGSGKLKIPKS